MLPHTEPRWGSIEQWSPTLFLVGGCLLLGHAAVQGITVFTDLTPPPDVFVTTGHLVALVGLIGLYPVLVDRTPRLARGAGAVAVVPLAGWLLMTITQFLTIAGIASSLIDTLPGAVIMLVPVATFLTYVLFGAATLRAGEGSRMVGILVLAPAALIVVLLAGSALTEAAAIVGLVVGSGLAVSMLALGYRLRTWNHPTEHAVPTGEASVG